MLSRLFPRGSWQRRLLRRLLRLDAHAPSHLAARFRPLRGLDMAPDPDVDDPTDSYGGRLAFARHHVIPWLDRARRLDGARVLEIGSGTGALTLALAEQGAVVTAMDLDAPAMGCATDRCAEAGLAVEFVADNATNVASRFAGRTFDLIIFAAALEHMTHAERIASLRQAWSQLRPGDLLVVFGTPNRLWWFDSHSAYLPFYLWLPDDLAFDYAHLAGTRNVAEIPAEPTPENVLAFVRYGRALSFHELDLAIRPSEELQVVSSLNLDLRRSSALNRLRWRFNREHRFEQFLRQAKPGLHPGFFTSYLNLIIRRD